MLSGTGGYKIDVTSDCPPQKIAEDTLAVVGVILSLIPLLAGGSDKTTDRQI